MWTELALALTGALVIFTFRVALGVRVTRGLARRFSIVDKGKISKFEENVFNVFFYWYSLAIGSIGLYNSGWLSIPLIPLKNCVGDSIPSVTSEWNGLFTQLYYGMAMSYYLQAAVTSVTIDTLRKDKWVMFSHHLITLLLVGGSAYTGRFRIGLLTLLTHDFSDVFLYAAKVLHYAKSTWDRPFFLIFGTSFIALRLVLLPILVYTCMESYRCDFGEIYLDLGSGWQDGAPYIFGSNLETFTLFGLTFTKFGALIAFLIGLVGLHAWWATIIIKMAVKGSTQDDRSDDEEDDRKRA